MIQIVNVEEFAIGIVNALAEAGHKRHRPNLTFSRSLTQVSRFRLYFFTKL